jgi:DNA gyrase subunit B
MRELVKNGCVYIAQPPLYRVERKNPKKSDSPRYVQTHQQMMAELVQLGRADSRLRYEPDKTEFDGAHFDRLIELIGRMEEPLELLDRRGVDLRYLVQNHLSPEGQLPRYRVFLGGEQRFFFDKPSLDEFLAHEEASRGEELKVADEQATATGADAATPPEAPPAMISTPDGEAAEEPITQTEAALHVLDLHEVRQINQNLKTLKEYGVTAANFLTGVNKAGEPVYPWAIKSGDGDVPLSSLRELLPEIRKMGEKGLRLTRFKGLG